MEMYLETLSSVNFILPMIDLKAERAAISKGLNLIPCNVWRLTLKYGVLGGVAPPKDREFPPMQYLIFYVLLLGTNWEQ